jgi:hypothetical protein
MNNIHMKLSLTVLWIVFQFLGYLHFVTSLFINMLIGLYYFFVGSDLHIIIMNLLNFIFIY